MGPFIFLDIETTGRDPKRDHIIEVAAVKWEDFCITERFESLVNPNVPVPYEIELLTGINSEMLKDAPAFADVRHQVAEFVGDLPIVGHNIAFDMSFLKIHIDELKNPEIDTIALAKVLLHKESSYALEVLMKKHGLPARGSHRAMADTETTVDFFEFLIGRIGEIDSKTLAIIKSVLTKSSWTGKVAFESHSFKKSSGSAGQSARKKNESSQQSSKNFFWKESTLGVLAEGNKIILESPAQIPFDAFKNERIVVAYESFQKRNELVISAQAAGLKIAVLKEPAFYISPKKLEKYIEQYNILAEETPFLLKLILWNAKTQSGDREEISVEREEYGIFENLADSEGDDIYFKKAAAAAEKSDVVLVHHSGLARGLVKNLSGQLIILEAARLEDSFTNAFRVRLTDSNLRPFFGEKATVAMGMLGIFYEHFMSVNDAGFNSNVVLNDDLRATVQWKRAISAFENLPTGKKQESIIKTLAPEENLIKWISSFADEVVFNSAPFNLGEYFRECTANFSHILMHDASISADGTFKLIRELFELDSSWSAIKEDFKGEIEPTLSLKFYEKFPNPYSSGYFKKCVALFSDIIKIKKGKCLFLMSSKKTVEAMYSALLPYAQESDSRLLGVGPSGGVGKSLALFLDKPDTSILISTNQVLPFLHEFEQHIETIVFQKIPFDPPDDPILSARGSQFDNGFVEYSLPRAIMRFREILNTLGNGTSKKVCHLLDSRLSSRDYGQLFTI